MPTKDKAKDKAKSLLKLGLEARRDLQYKFLEQWNRGRITGRKAIEEIADLEKVIFISKEDMQRINNGNIPRPKDGGKSIQS